MKISAKEASALLCAHDRILILSHKNPDGDTLGSAYGLLRALRSLGKTVRTQCADRLPRTFSYLADGVQQEDFTPWFVVAVDVASVSLLGDAVAEAYPNVDLCIDHHHTNELYAQKTYLYDGASACEAVYEVISKMGVPITPDLADCLYTGMATDTGCFRFSNTTPKTMRLAADLMEQGARYAELNRLLFETKSKERLAVERMVLDTISYAADGKIALICISQEMVKQSGADESELGGISGIPRTIEGVEIGITMREKETGGYKISVRTAAYADASKLCAAFGGGGHIRAAGCVIDAPYEQAKAMLLEEAARFLQ